MSETPANTNNQSVQTGSNSSAELQNLLSTLISQQHSLMERMDHLESTSQSHQRVADHNPPTDHNMAFNHRQTAGNLSELQDSVPMVNNIPNQTLTNTHFDPRSAAHHSNFDAEMALHRVHMQLEQARHDHESQVIRDAEEKLHDVEMIFKYAK